MSATIRAGGIAVVVGGVRTVITSCFLFVSGFIFSCWRADYRWRVALSGMRDVGVQSMSAQRALDRRLQEWKVEWTLLL